MRGYQRDVGDRLQVDLSYNTHRRKRNKVVAPVLSVPLCGKRNLTELDDALSLITFVALIRVTMNYLFEESYSVTRTSAAPVKGSQV